MITAGSVAAYALVAGLWWCWFARDYERHAISPTRGYRDIQDMGLPVQCWLVCFSAAWPLTTLVFVAHRVCGQNWKGTE
jgi:hypothetical protein